jgi:hypothetical protein
MRRLLLIVSLALLFGLGQQGVAVHAITHLAEHQETQNKGTPQHQVCDKCVVYSGLAGAVATGTFWTAPSGPHHALPTPGHLIAFPYALSFHFSARAPPPALS